MKMRWVFPLILPASLVLGACGTPESAPESESPALADGKADSAVPFSKKAAGMTVTVDRYASLTTRDGNHVYVLRGTSTKNLKDAFSFVPDDPFCQANVTGKRSFEIVVREDYELNSLLSGLPLFVRLDPTSGDSVTLSVTLAPRFYNFTGSSVVQLDTRLDPVWSGGNVVYRGSATLGSGYTNLEAQASDGVQPFVKSLGKSAWRVDFIYAELVLAADPPSDPVHFYASTPAGTTKEKKAAIGVNVTALDITTGDPYEVWAPSCKPAVKKCIDASTKQGVLDLASCGTYRQVLQCGPIAIAPEPQADTVVTDFRAYLVDFYASGGANYDGANTLDAAEAAVSAEAVSRVLTTYDDPNAHDISLYYIFRHPDPVFPGSDTAWFVVYSKLTGKLVEIYSFN